LWQLGYTDQAAERSKSAIELAHELSHPLTLAIAYSYTAMFHQFRRDTDSARQKAEEAISISRDHGFPYYIAWGTLIDGWAKALEGDPGEQIPYMSKGLTDLQSTGAERSQSYYLALLAEVYARSDRADEALNLLRQAISFVDQKNERWWESELYRLKGDILLNLNETEPEVEKSYQKAVQVALRQNAKSLELRAQMSLSRLLLSQGKNSEAKNILSETVEWFTEGHDNKELTEAKNLVLEL
jgi:predicted ATPase